MKQTQTEEEVLRPHKWCSMKPATTLCTSSSLTIRTSLSSATAWLNLQEAASRSSLAIVFCPMLTALSNSSLASRYFPCHQRIDTTIRGDHSTIHKHHIKDSVIHQYHIERLDIHSNSGTYLLHVQYTAAVMHSGNSRIF